MPIDNDRRSGTDRRKQAGLNLRILAGDGNRRNIRRKEDTDRIFLVDQYSPMLFVSIIAIFFLCCVDALLTLFLLNHGAYEANPIMAYLLNIGPYFFFIPKYAITLLATFSLFLFRGIVFRVLKVSTHSMLHVIACIYTAVVTWELYLVYHTIIRN